MTTQGERVAALETAFEYVKSAVEGLRVDMVGGQEKILERLDTANDSMAAVKKEQHRMEGGLAVLKWVIATMVGGMAAGAAITGVIVAVA